MTNRTRALGHRLLGSLKNENVVVVFNSSTSSISLLNAKTGKTFALVRENEWGEYYVATADGTQEWHDSFAAAVNVIKAERTYPAPKEHARLDARPKVRTAPKHMGVKMGSFVPGASI